MIEGDDAVIIEYVDNPLVIPTLVPVASYVYDAEIRLESRIDVTAETVYDEEKTTPPLPPPPSQPEEVASWGQILNDIMTLGFLLSFLGGFIVFLVWMNKPTLVGGGADD
jgi:hypothetical protein